MIVPDPTPEYNFPPHKQGDTWKGLTAITFNYLGSAVNLSGAEVKMQVRYQIDSPCVLDLSSDTGDIVILDPPTNGTITIPPRIVDIPTANYLYDLKVIYPDGYIKTYFRGIFPVTSHLTR